MKKIHDELFPEGTKFLTKEKRKQRVKQLGYLKLCCSALSTFCFVAAMAGVYIIQIFPYTHWFLLGTISFIVLKRILSVVAELHINAEIRNEYYEKSVADYKKILSESMGDENSESDSN